jgi:hypothetical protein
MRFEMKIAVLQLAKGYQVCGCARARGEGQSHWSIAARRRLHRRNQVKAESRVCAGRKDRQVLADELGRITGVCGPGRHLERVGEWERREREELSILRHNRAQAAAAQRSTDVQGRQIRVGPARAELAAAEAMPANCRHRVHRIARCDCANGVQSESGCLLRTWHSFGSSSAAMRKPLPAIEDLRRLTTEAPRQCAALAQDADALTLDSANVRAQIAAAAEILSRGRQSPSISGSPVVNSIE